MRKLVLPIVALAALAVLVLPAGATYPGTNGEIIYSKNLEPGPELGVHEIFKHDGADGAQLSDTFPEAAINSDWSPDGSRIAFDVGQDPDILPDIWIMNADGTGQTQLTVNDWWDAFPSWSPDEQWIVMESDGPNYPATQGIWQMNPDGTGLAQITTIPAGVAFDSEPAVSPGSEWIALTRFRNTCRFPHRHPFIPPACPSANQPLRPGGPRPAWRPRRTIRGFSSTRPSRSGTPRPSPRSSGKSRQRRRCSSAALRSGGIWRPSIPRSRTLPHRWALVRGQCLGASSYRNCASRSWAARCW